MKIKRYNLIKWKLSSFLFLIFSLFASGGLVLADDSNPSVFVVPLSPPSDLRAVVINDEQIDLSWSLVSGATSYNVYSSGILIALVDTNFYSVTGLDDGTSYSFTVSSVSILEESSQSSPVLAVTLEKIQDIPSRGGGNIYSNLVVPARRKGLVPPSGGFKVLINNGLVKTNNLSVVIQLDGGPNATQVEISNNSDFKSVVSMKYAKIKTWVLSEKDGEKTVYVKFLNSEGESSPISSDSIILDTSLPQINITKIKDFYRVDEEIILEGTVDEPAEIIFYWDKKYGLIKTGDNKIWAVNLGKMSLGGHSVILMAKDNVNNLKTIVVEVSVMAQESPVEKPTQPFYFLPFIFENIEEKIKSVSRFISPKQEAPLKIVIVSQDTPRFLDGEWDLLPVKWL